MKNKNSIKREDLSSNILKKAILRIDFLRIINIQEFVAEVQRYLVIPDFYLTNDNFVNNIEFEINDPDRLSANEVNVKKTIKREQVYTFKHKDKNIEILISESCIIFNVDCKMKYSLNSCIDIFCDLVILLQGKYNYIKFIRIGLRKINNIICKDDNLYECFVETFMPNIESEQILDKKIQCSKRQTIDNFNYNEHLFNVIKIIQEGFVQNSTNQRAFNVILDIDTYLKESLLSQFKDYEDVKQTIVNINYDLFDVFKSQLTESFLNDLISGESNKIEWGINKNDRF